MGLSPVPDHVGVVLRSAAVQPREAALLMAAAVKLARKYKKVGPTLARMYFGVPGGGGGLSSLTFDFRRDAENAGRAARLPYSWDEARAAEVPVFHLAGLHVYVESRAASATP